MRRMWPRKGHFREYSIERLMELRLERARKLLGDPQLFDLPVAEVAARFTLDAMPGKQMSIDADMRSGIIDANQQANFRTSTLTARRSPLQPDQLADTLLRQAEQRLELRPREPPLLPRRLDLDDVARARQHEVGVSLGVGILFVIKLQDRRPLDSL